MTQKQSQSNNSVTVIVFNILPIVGDWAGDGRHLDKNRSGHAGDGGRGHRYLE